MYPTSWQFPNWHQHLSLTQLSQSLSCSAPEEETPATTDICESDQDRQVVNKEIETNAPSSTSHNKNKINKHHFVLLSEHTDHKLIDLMSKNIDFIKSNYDTILAECVPSNLENHSVIKYLQDIFFTYTIKIEPMLIQKIKSISAEEVKFLDRKLNVGEDKNEFIEKRLKILEKLLEKISLPGLEYYATNFKNLKLYELALSKGLRIQGCEPENYVPGEEYKTRDEERDQSIWKTLQKCHKEGKCVFSNFGTFHGIALIENTKKNNDIKSSVIHLRVKEKDEAEFFNKWKSSHKTDLLSIPHLNFASIQIASHNPANVQNKIFSMLPEIDKKQTPLSYYQEGCEFYDKEKYEDALASLIIALELFKDDDSKALQIARCLSTIGSCFRDLGDLKIAQAVLKQACATLETKNLTNTKSYSEHKEKYMKLMKPQS